MPSTVTVVSFFSLAIREEVEDALLRRLTQELQLTIVPVWPPVWLLLSEEEPPVTVTPPALMPLPTMTSFGAANAAPATLRSVNATSRRESAFLVLMV